MLNIHVEIEGVLLTGVGVWEMELQKFPLDRPVDY